MKVEKHNEGFWCATGNGDMRPIIVEAYTRSEAVEGWADVYAQQYAEMESKTEISLAMGEFV